MQTQEKTDGRVFWEKHYESVYSLNSTNPERRTVAWQRTRRQEIIRAALNRLPKPLKIAEVGCGEAIDLAAVASPEVRLLLGVDYSRNASLVAKSTLRRCPSAEVVRGDLRRLPLQAESLSLIFSSGAIEHFENPSEVVEELKQAIGDGGILITFVPNKSSLWTVYRHARNTLSKISKVVPAWPVWETSFSIPELTRLVTRAGLLVDYVSGTNVAYILEPIEMVTAKLGTDFWATRSSRILWQCVIHMENSEFIRNLLGMELCIVAHKA